MTGAPIRLHTTSAGLAPRDLVPGRDLVLHLHVAHGSDVPMGTYVLDHLAASDRHAADAAALRTQAAWRARFDDALTVDGLCWPFVWELELYRVLNPAVARALALRRALVALAPGSIELADQDPGTNALASALGASLGISVARSLTARPAGDTARRRPAPPPARRVRQRAMRIVTMLGAPTALRSGSVPVHAYWPVMPALDRMLEQRRARPAIFLEKRPSGVRRTLRAAACGGWIGVPTVGDRRYAVSPATRMIAAVRAAHRLDVDGLELGAWLLPKLAGVVEQRAADGLAHARMLRRAFRSRRPSRILGAYDVDPAARLMVLLAQEAGIPTVMLCHGAYLLPQPLADLDVCDEVVLWTRAVAPAMTRWDRPIYELGYPLPHRVPPPTRYRSPGRPRIAVLGQVPVFSTSVLDERITMRCFDTALAAIARAFPDAAVFLRPHPSQDRTICAELSRRFPQLELHAATAGDILELLGDVDLSIGGASTATLQGALVGAPVVALNLSGDEWPFPLGGDTSVPVARAGEDLDAILERWSKAGTLPGRDDLLGALGADGSDPVVRLLEVIDR